MTDKEPIDLEDYENCYDNPTLNYVKTNLILVQSKKVDNEEFQDPFTLKESIPINTNIPTEIDEDSSSDSIEVVTLEDNIPRPNIITQKQINNEQNGLDNAYEKVIKQETKEKQERTKYFKELLLNKKEVKRKVSINIFDEPYIFSNLINNPQPNIFVIDPKIDLLRFLFSPPPKNVVVKCQLNKTNKKDKTMLFTKFIFSLQISEENDKGDIITLMAARSRKKSRTLNYIISTDASEMRSKSSALIGKMKGNFLGTKFVFLNNKRPLSASKEEDEVSEESASETASNCPQIKSMQFESIGAAFYKGTSVIKRKPREIDVVIPEWNDDKECYAHNVTLPNDRNEFNNSSNISVFNNISPTYDKEMKCFTLNFGGRVKCISGKNFALETKIGDRMKRVYQFGKCKDHYIIDYTYPLCAFQAFAIGLSSCHRKIATD